MSSRDKLLQPPTQTSLPLTVLSLMFDDDRIHVSHYKFMIGVYRKVVTMWGNTRPIFRSRDFIDTCVMYLLQTEDTDQTNETICTICSRLLACSTRKIYRRRFKSQNIQRTELPELVSSFDLKTTTGLKNNTETT